MQLVDSQKKKKTHLMTFLAEQLDKCFTYLFL